MKARMIAVLVGILAMTKKLKINEMLRWVVAAVGVRKRLVPVFSKLMKCGQIC